MKSNVPTCICIYICVYLLPKCTDIPFAHTIYVGMAESAECHVRSMHRRRRWLHLYFHLHLYLTNHRFSVFCVCVCVNALSRVWWIFSAAESLSIHIIFEKRTNKYLHRCWLTCTTWKIIQMSFILFDFILCRVLSFYLALPHNHLRNNFAAFDF